ncbi:hypothetical protein D3C78_1813050 [compost metagenome]
MAQFNIEAYLKQGKRVSWLAIADDGETLSEVMDQVAKASTKKFGLAAPLRRWSVMQASNGCITVTMQL